MKIGIGLALWAMIVSASDATGEGFALNASSVAMQGNDIRIESFQGRPAIRAGAGRAVLSHAGLRDGTIEFDMWVEGNRAFAYVQMRRQSDTEFEEIYFRPHKSTLPDAAQYSPVFQGRSSWQLYHGAGATAPVALPAGRWIPIKIHLQGQRLALTVDGEDEPSMVVESLGHPSATGGIAFRGFVPRTSNANYAAYFSNIRITPAAPTPQVTEASTVPSPGVVRQWRISQPFSPDGALSQSAAPSAAGDSILADVQANGVLEFFRHLTIPAGMRPWASVAEVAIHSPRPQLCKLHLGFSDQILVSLDGRPILYQNASYSFDQPRRDGLLHSEQAVVFLDLEENTHRLSATVADSFGGWGLYARLEDCPGAKIAP